MSLHITVASATVTELAPLTTHAHERALDCCPPRADQPDLRSSKLPPRVTGSRAERISHAGNIPSVTTRDRHSRHRAVRDAETAQVAVTADQDAARAEKVTAVLIKLCRTVLTERCCYITNNESLTTIANNSGRRVTQVSSHVTLRILYRSSSRALYRSSSDPGLAGGVADVGLDERVVDQAGDREGGGHDWRTYWQKWRTPSSAATRTWQVCPGQPARTAIVSAGAPGALDRGRRRCQNRNVPSPSWLHLLRTRGGSVRRHLGTALGRVLWIFESWSCRSVRCWSD
jgi:hypothetical protein